MVVKVSINYFLFVVIHLILHCKLVYIQIYTYVPEKGNNRVIIILPVTVGKELKNIINIYNLFLIKVIKFILRIKGEKRSLYGIRIL